MYWGRRTSPPNETRGYGRKAERNAALIADYHGVGTPTLARRYGVSQQRAHQILVNAGIVPRPRGIRQSSVRSWKRWGRQEKA